MGVVNNCNISIFSQKKELISQHFIEGTDELLDGLITDGGAIFDPSKYGEFSAEESKTIMIYFDKDSMSVGENCAEVTPNIQDPKKLKNVWLKVRYNLVQTHANMLKTYRSDLLKYIEDMKEVVNELKNKKQGLFKKKSIIELPEEVTEISEYKFRAPLFTSELD